MFVCVTEPDEDVYFYNMMMYMYDYENRETTSAFFTEYGVVLGDEKYRITYNEDFTKNFKSILAESNDTELIFEFKNVAIDPDWQAGYVNLEAALTRGNTLLEDSINSS